MRLPSLAWLDLDVRMGPAHLLEHRVELGAPSPVRIRSPPRSPSSTRPTTSSATSPRSSSAATAAPSTNPMYAPFRIVTPSSTASRDATVTSPVATEASASSMSRSFSPGVFVVMYRYIAAGLACTDVEGTTRTGFEARPTACFRREDHVRVVREDDHLGLGHHPSIASTISAGRGVRRLAALDHPRGPEALEELPGFPPRGLRRTGPSRARGANRPIQQPLLAFGGLLVHVHDLDPLDEADFRRDRQRRPRVVGVHVDLQRRVVADNEERVPELLERALERDLVEPLALDDEHGAVSELRQLLVDRLQGERVALDGCVGERLAGQGEDDAAQDLHEAGAPGIDDAGAPEDVEHLRRARRRVLAARSTAPRNSGGGGRRFSCFSPSSAISRMTVSIVPSTGPLHGPVAASLAARKAPPEARGARVLELAQGLDEPRTICEKMTPEFPRAP